MTYTPSMRPALTLAERIAAARAERAPRTQVERTVWAREFLTVAQRDGWLGHLDGPHYTYAVELRDQGFTPADAAARVRFSLL